jgi:hypothetical protein
MTKEHAWPQWLGEGEDVEPQQVTRTIGFGRSGEHEMTEAPNTVVSKPGSALTARIREVCASCNNGWMSRLETAAEPLLRRLWVPSYPLGVTTFTSDEATVLATWATKTAWVRERVSNPVVTPTTEMRLALMEEAMPPKFTQVWVSRYSGKNNFSVNVGRLQASHEGEPWNTSIRRNILVCLLTFRGLTILVRTDDGWGVPEAFLPDDKWRQLWPASDLLWPPAQEATDWDLREVSSRFSNWLNMPDVPRFNRDPNGIQHIRRN